MNDRDYKRYFQLAEAAELYFLKYRQRAENAERINVSRSLVSGKISEARKRGVVSISIKHFFRRSGEQAAELILSREY